MRGVCSTVTKHVPFLENDRDLSTVILNQRTESSGTAGLAPVCLSS